MKKLLATIVCLAMSLSMLTACGKAENSTSTADSTPASESVSESEPLPPPEPPYDPAVLTGLPKDGDYPQNQRLLAVMINNISDSSSQNARPQNGIGSADVLIEIKVEGGITRFCGLFTDYTTLPTVCPVRSARDQFFQLFVPFQPIHAHIGQSIVMPQFIKTYNYGDLEANFDAIGFKRVTDRPGVEVEHRAYIDAEAVQKAIDKLDIDTRREYNSTFFDFVNYNEPARVLPGPDAVKISITHAPRYKTYFDWNAETGKYMMSQYSHYQRAVHETIDKNTNEQLGFENVLVIFAPFSVWPDPGHSGYDLQNVDYTLGGVGYYFNGGKAEEIHWEKGDAFTPLRIVNADGTDNTVKFNPGKTYVAVVSTEEAPNFSFDTGIAPEAESASEPAAAE